MQKRSNPKKVGTDWEARFHSNRKPQVKVLDKAFAGIPAGARMLVVTPEIVDEVLAAIPPGVIVQSANLRQTLATRHGAQHTCPVTTGIALHVVAERAYLRMQRGEKPITPFWRAIDPDSDLAGKLTCGRAFLHKMRLAENGQPGAQADTLAVRNRAKPVGGSRRG